MPAHDPDSIPESVGGTLDPELAAWLPSDPTFGADVSIAQGRQDHAILGEGPQPEIGALETLAEASTKSRSRCGWSSAACHRAILDSPIS